MQKYTTLTICTGPRVSSRFLQNNQEAMEKWGMITLGNGKETSEKERNSCKHWAACSMNLMSIPAHCTSYVCSCLALLSALFSSFLPPLTVSPGAIVTDHSGDLCVGDGLWNWDNLIVFPHWYRTSVLVRSFISIGSQFFFLLRCDRDAFSN